MRSRSVAASSPCAASAHIESRIEVQLRRTGPPESTLRGHVTLSGPPPHQRQRLDARGSIATMRERATDVWMRARAGAPQEPTARRSRTGVAARCLLGVAFFNERVDVVINGEARRSPGDGVHQERLAGRHEALT